MECNYDLNGVPEKEQRRTCPECGHHNPLVGPPDPPAPKIAKSVAQSLLVTTGLFLLAMIAAWLEPKRVGTLRKFVEILVMLGGIGAFLSAVTFSIWLPIRIFRLCWRVHAPMILAGVTFVITAGLQILLLVGLFSLATSLEK